MASEITKELTEDGEIYRLNMGPQHPSMHGVLRLFLDLQGEQLVKATPVIGYSHRAHEKMAEHRTAMQFLPNTSRVDYLSGMIYNVGYCQAIEKILEIEVPERAVTIRIIANELNRIASHLLWLGTFLLDLGGITPFLYCFDDRETILDLLDRISGSRLTYCYARFGGVTLDVDDVFLNGTSDFIQRMRGRLEMYAKLVTGNAIFRERCEGVGVISMELAKSYGMTGPCLRASGLAYDVRRAEPYGGYGDYDFEVPVRTEGDTMARYHVRMQEMAESCKIIEQALRKLPDGPILTPKLAKRFKLPEG
ncbi:MAG: NADH-quinone oxidoreductase subunit D, partial [Planctomycetes bacterium]|nr:NADH-quinone oxidoreductase subunit D [Planctomycetota bacterium]